MVTISDERLCRAIEIVQEPFRAALDLPFVQDVAFIGNTGGTYSWTPAFFIDVDICVFVDQMNLQAGEWLVGTGALLRNALDSIGIDFELRIIRGAYKPAMFHLTRPIALAHLAVFTERSYLDHGALLRWGWRKYPCLREPGRLMKLAPACPTPADLLHGPRGVRERLAAVRAGKVEMTEHRLPSFTEHQLIFHRDDPIFVEYCLSACASMARSHARVLGHGEADRLGNPAFFLWYVERLLHSEALQKVVELKNRVRKEGYRVAAFLAESLTERFLTELAVELQRGSVPPPNEEGIRG